MKKGKEGLKRASFLALGAWLAAPSALWAHPGHPWLEGATRPMLGLDHFLAFTLVVVAITAAVMTVATRRSAGAKVERRP